MPSILFKLWLYLKSFVENLRSSLSKSGSFVRNSPMCPNVATSTVRRGLDLYPPLIYSAITYFIELKGSFV